MKSSILKMLFGVAGCFFLLSATPINTSKPIKAKEHTAYWYVKSGEEFIQVKKAVIPESALTKDNNGKLTGADENVMQNKVQFSNQKNHNGKKVDAHFIILSDGENLDEMGSMVQHKQSGKSGNDYFYTALYCATMKAFSQCWNGAEAPSACWGFTCYCNYWSNGTCLVIQNSTGLAFHITYFAVV